MAAGPVRSSGGGAPSHTRRGAVVFYALMYCLMSSTMLVVNKAAMSAFPHPNSVLLAQLASSAALARLAGALGRAEVDALEAAKVAGTLPMTAAFFLVLYTSMNALHHVNVDTMVVLRTTTPITVAVGEWLFLNTALPSPRTWASLSAVVLLTAAAFSLHFAAISTAGLAWLASWFASVTFYMVYSAHYVKAVKLTIMGRVYYENLLSCALCVPAAALSDLPHLLAGGSTGRTAAVAATALIGASCLMGFSMNWFGWALRQHITALSYTVLGVLNKLLTVFINLGIWEKHGPPMSQALLVAGIMAGTAYQQQAAAPAAKAGPQQLPHFPGKRRPLGMLGSMLAAMGAIAVLIWLGASMGRFLDRAVGAGGSDAPLVVNAAYIAQLNAAAQTPIRVALMTSVPWSIDAPKTAGCVLHGVPLDCRFDAQPTQDVVAAADALYYHLPTLPAAAYPAAKAHPNQLRLAMSLEPGDLVPRLDDPGFMCHFDAEMSYRLCAQIVNHIGLEQLDGLIKPPAVAFERKQHAAAYIQDRCSDSSHRSELVRALIEMGSSAQVPVHSMGQCQNNQPWPGSLTRAQVLARYKFCLTLERTNSFDFVSQQLWEALAAGCIPVYLGTANIRERLPDPRAVIVYDRAGGGDAASPAELAALMHRIGSSSAEFEARQAWRAKQPHELAQASPQFAQLWELRGVTGECLLCRFLAAHRVRPRMRYTPCLFNSTWMGAAGRQVHRVKCGDAQQHRR